MTRSRLHFSVFQLSTGPETGDRAGEQRLRRSGHKSSAFLSTSLADCGVCEEGPRSRRSKKRPRTKCICLAVRVWLISKQLPPLSAELLEQFKYIVITIITNTNGEQIRTPSGLIPLPIKSVGHSVLAALPSPASVLFVFGQRKAYVDANWPLKFQNIL